MYRNVQKCARMCKEYVRMCKNVQECAGMCKCEMQLDRGCINNHFIPFLSFGDKLPHYSSLNIMNSMSKPRACIWACNKTFARKYTLRRHLESVHGEALSAYGNESSEMEYKAQIERVHKLTEIQPNTSSLFSPKCSYQL